MKVSFPYKVYVSIGHLLHKLSLPLVRLFIQRTTRAYVLLIDRDEVLVTKNWLGDNKWALPGGGIGRNENPATALSRELHEEVGLQMDASNFELVSEGTWKTERLNFKYLIYKTGVSKNNLDIRLNRIELTDFDSIKIKGLDRLFA
jgi:8-oxo-dGTP pyrophosphatase MutT (NUDIX family)